MEDENVLDTSVSMIDPKQELTRKISQKLINANEKSILILLDNFNHLFTSNDHFKASLEILNDLFSLKKKYK